MLFNVNPAIVFWMGSSAALVLMGLLLFARPRANQTAQVMNALGANQPQVTAKMALGLFRLPKLWMFILYVVGVACVYDVFDQQFATFLNRSSQRRRRARRRLVSPPQPVSCVTPSLCSAHRGSLTASARRTRC